MTLKTLVSGLMISMGCLSMTSAWAQKKPAGACFVAHFKSLALRTHAPEVRASMAKDWLERNAGSCTDVQLATLLANSPNWLGTALTLEISSILEGAIEAKIAGNPELMGKLYESLGKEGQASTVTHSTPTPRAPVVRPMVNTGVIAGSPNFGSITGNTTVNQNNNQLSNASSSNASNSNQNASPDAISSTNITNPQMPQNSAR
ncbi:hypothetical protein [Limnohabitans sp.]|uniref:hypothetical protein n=2 Tax=Limnohabitans sp. TaxID=1907725 RepID=UPI0039BD8F07|nr:hypothetical protein [Comamonadaceae bacterium]